MVIHYLKTEIFGLIATMDINKPTKVKGYIHGLEWFREQRISSCVLTPG